MEITAKDILPKLGTLECISIWDEIKPFLNEEVVKMCGNVIEETGDPESTELHSCYMQKTCTGGVKEMDLQWLAMFANKNQEDGKIETGVLCHPFKMKLHTLEDDKWVICLFPFTKIPNSQLINKK